MAYDTYTSLNIKSSEFTDLSVRAKIKLNLTRKTGIKTGYRPNHVFEYNDNGNLNTFIGEIQFDKDKTLLPGEEGIVKVRFLFTMPLEKYINIGRQWFIHEGKYKIGEAEIIEIIEQPSVLLE